MDRRRGSHGLHGLGRRLPDPGASGLGGGGTPTGMGRRRDLPEHLRRIHEQGKGGVPGGRGGRCALLLRLGRGRRGCGVRSAGRRGRELPGTLGPRSLGRPVGGGGEMSVEPAVYRWLVLILLVAAFMVLMTSAWMTDRLIFLPDASDPGAPPTLRGGVTGEVIGEEVILEAADGVSLRAWWFDAGEGAPAVLFLHGNAGHYGHRVFQAEGMLGEGVSVLLLGYRGYGRSGVGSRPTEGGVGLDADAGYRWLAARVGGPDRLVVHGRSVGGAVAGGLLRDAEVAPAGVILESTFTDLEGIAGAVYPWLVRVLPSFLLRRIHGRFDVRGALAEFSPTPGPGPGSGPGAPGEREPPAPMPLLVIHGEADRLIPVEMGRALHEVARENPALETRPFLGVPGAGHNDLPMTMGAGYFARVGAFVRSATGEAPPTGREGRSPTPGEPPGGSGSRERSPEESPGPGSP
ncbi:MAG: alpha/beta hydrolase [Gemmatimonadales bacterium]|nr:MAG: alpha/beta hydrolase [Gemmatimonadales bacterium]